MTTDAVITKAAHSVEVSAEEAWGDRYLSVDCSCGWTLSGPPWWEWLALKAVVEDHLAGASSPTTGATQ